MHPEIRSRSRMHLDHMHTPASAVRIPAEHGGYVKTQLPACFEHRNSKREPRRGDESGWCLSSSSVESRVPLEFSQTSARPDLYHRATLAWPQHQQQTRIDARLATSLSNFNSPSPASPRPGSLIFRLALREGAFGQREADSRLGSIAARAKSGRCGKTHDGAG
ncbi:hypothetical protein PaG_02310 [Moesziomyces aphidis]|uniref:Uncharacterized protein n=1 Tax=Moesziomyces aphidis TaxID=84754 RepID=W3VT36_MOEAP|nr:hypothetical protein PaG_02310 [Moesziomyces aphidis]